MYYVLKYVCVCLLKMLVNWDNSPYMYVNLPVYVHIYFGIKYKLIYSKTKKENPTWEIMFDYDVYER